MDKRYYKKKGASYRERVRCPLCGKLSSIGYFSQDHDFSVVQYRYGGKGDITVTIIEKDALVMQGITESIIQRLRYLISKLSKKPMEGIVHPPLRPPLIVGRIIPKEVIIDEE